MTRLPFSPLSDAPPDLPPQPAASGRWRGWLALSGLAGVSVLSAWSLSTREEISPTPPPDRPNVGVNGDEAPPRLPPPGSPASEELLAQTPPAPEPPPLASTALTEVEAAFVGRWETDFHGRMRIEKRPDHTAELVIDFDFLASLLYGSRLTLQLEWKVEGNILTHNIVGGEPADARERLIRDYGRSCSYEILERSEDFVRLRETTEPMQEYLWRRWSLEALPGELDPP